ncbi:MAG: glutamate 5-kinase [Clostridia bacterium]|nr:glutamate 5-kinase [Clostridia bacterium]
MELIKNRIVVKVGTSTLTHESGALDIRTIDKLAQVLSAIRNSGYEVVLVSSAAIAVGVSKMRLPERPREIRMKQAAAAVGQCELMHIYDKVFSEYGNLVAQILLTSDDVETLEKKQNLSNTFSALLENGIIPIVNENDSVSYAQIETKHKVFGDNDTLSAVVAVLCGAEKLLILSDIDGLYDGNPKGDEPVHLISRVERIDDSIRALTGGAGTSRGTGGMITKLEAAEIVTEKGIDMYIVNGSHPEYIYDVLDGRLVGTHFVGRKSEVKDA